MLHCPAPKQYILTYTDLYRSEPNWKSCTALYHLVPVRTNTYRYIPICPILYRYTGFQVKGSQCMLNDRSQNRHGISILNKYISRLNLEILASSGGWLCSIDSCDTASESVIELIVSRILWSVCSTAINTIASFEWIYRQLSEMRNTGIIQSQYPDQ